MVNIALARSCLDTIPMKWKKLGKISNNVESLALNPCGSRQQHQQLITLLLTFAFIVDCMLAMAIYFSQSINKIEKIPRVYRCRYERRARDKSEDFGQIGGNENAESTKLNDFIIIYSINGTRAHNCSTVDVNGKNRKIGIQFRSNVVWNTLVYD